ncbi:MAG: hypothetical protein ACK55Z_08030, partial [bacterium]
LLEWIAWYWIAFRLFQLIELNLKNRIIPCQRLPSSKSFNLSLVSNFNEFNFFFQILKFFRANRTTSIFDLE